MRNELDWKAWLLCNLVKENALDRNGCLFGRNYGAVRRFQLLWNVVLFES
jgi:hypothetical protein